MQDEWKTSVTPTTPSQINQFFDACTEWILQPQTDAYDLKQIHFPASSVVEDEDLMGKQHSIGVNDEDVHLHPTRRCFRCDQRTSSYLNANPFLSGVPSGNVLAVCAAAGVTCYLGGPTLFPVQIRRANSALKKAALMIAVLNGDSGILKILLQNNVSPNIVNDIGKTPLMIAAEQGNASSVTELLKHNAEIYQQDGKGFSALMYASKSLNYDCVNRLLKKGNNNINDTNKNGDTALSLLQKTEQQMLDAPPTNNTTLKDYTANLQKINKVSDILIDNGAV